MSSKGWKYDGTNYWSRFCGKKELNKRACSTVRERVLDNADCSSEIADKYFENEMLAVMKSGGGDSQFLLELILSSHKSEATSRQIWNLKTSFVYYRFEMLLSFYRKSHLCMKVCNRSWSCSFCDSNKLRQHEYKRLIIRADLGRFALNIDLCNFNPMVYEQRGASPDS